MALVTITEAAKLAEKARKTLYAHIKQGKLSTTIDSDNQRKIDTSELIRVYGNIKQGNAKVTDKVTSEVTTSNVTGNTISLSPEQLELIISKAVEKALLNAMPLLLENLKPATVNTQSNEQPAFNRVKQSASEPEQKITPDNYLDGMNFLSSKH